MVLQWLRWMGMAAGLSIAAVATRADVVPELYAVSVPVAGQTNADLQRAAAAGLRELAVRVSGRSDAESSSALTAAFASADRYLEQYRYERNPVSDAGGAPWLAQLRFSAGSVEQLIRGAGLPIWGANRPLLQVWAVVGDGKTRRFVDESDPLIAPALRLQAQRRGVVIRFPKSFAGVSTDDVAQLNSAKVQAGAPPRQGEILLLGDLVTAGGSGWKGRWALNAGSQPLLAQGEGANLGDALRPAFDRFIDELSAQYATAASGVGEGIGLRVSGIENFDDYAALLNYLGRLNAIKTVSPVQVSGNEVVLQLKLQGTIEQLIRQIALESRLTQATDAVGSSPLSYRWIAPRG